MRWTAAAFNSSNALPQAVADSFRGARVAGEKLQGGRGERVSTGKKPERAGAGAAPRRAIGCTSSASVPVLLPCEVLPAFSPLFPSLPGEPPRGSYPLLPSHPGRPPSAFSLISSSSPRGTKKFLKKCKMDATFWAFRGSLYIEVCDRDAWPPRRPAGGPCRSRGEPPQRACVRAVWGGAHARTGGGGAPPAQ